MICKNSRGYRGVAWWFSMAISLQGKGGVCVRMKMLADDSRGQKGVRELQMEQDEGERGIRKCVRYSGRHRLKGCERKKKTG